MKFNFLFIMVYCFLFVILPHGYGFCYEGVMMGGGALPEGASVVGFKVPLDGVCEYLVHSKELSGGGSESEREYSVFKFSDYCDCFNLDSLFQIGSGAMVDDIPELIKDYDMARAIVMSPQGEGWEGAMVVLKKSRINDIIMIDRRDGVWDIDIRVCENEFDNDSCRMAGFSFPSGPKFLGDIRAYWID